jgi:hypothetical protein
MGPETAVGHTIVPWRGRYLAAVLACGDGAVLSHRSAADLWGIRHTATPKIDVTVSHTSGVRSSGRRVVHRTRRPVERVVLDGIPVTTPGRTLADLATALPRRQIEKAAEMAEALELHVEIDPSHPGAKRLAEILAAHDLGTDTKSDVEEEFRARDALLTARGWRVIRFTTRQVRGEPATVAARVISARSPSLATL